MVALPVALAAATDENAAPSIIASTEMFIAPARSATYSPHAARASGTLSRTPLDRIVAALSAALIRTPRSGRRSRDNLVRDDGPRGHRPRRPRRPGPPIQHRHEHSGQDERQHQKGLHHVDQV